MQKVCQSGHPQHEVELGGIDNHDDIGANPPRRIVFTYHEGARMALYASQYLFPEPACPFPDFLGAEQEWPPGYRGIRDARKHPVYGSQQE
ncbi:hypothetical protein NDU88_004067 [Pleurodeles waltl]|uniref:Uncharacterized protein n=1 Tax=Pleurodeles waltl TaxID=8319 RepID=A0AAV7WWM0_PLEWA|nr:hypothetical protein NDU88_004067 [Pleurodeles waltl]